MSLNPLDIAVFLIFFLFVLGVSLIKGRREKNSKDYFLAGRNLTWPLIGLSLIAANISTEQFVGMNGGAAGNVGLAIASYDWIAAASLVIVAWFFLPRLLRGGIYTIPEYLEQRFCPATRAIVSLYMMVIYIGVSISAVLYSGGLTLYTIFDMDQNMAIWLVGIVAALYTTYGGLKSVAWADLFLGSALLIGGFLVLGYGLHAVGGIAPLVEANRERMHTVLPSDHPALPWPALLLGIWIASLYYWGVNQYIAQRTLAAKSLKEGQLGVLLAATIQLILPLIIVVPGLIAVQLYGDSLERADAAFPLLIRELIPAGLKGFVFAAISGAVISSLASMLNSTSTIFTMDLFVRHLRPDTSPKTQVLVGRISTVICVLIGCTIARSLQWFDDGIFHYMQEFQGFVTPGILACFLFGFFIKRTPASAAVAGLLVSTLSYGLMFAFPATKSMCFLNRMGISFLAAAAIMAIITISAPMKEEKKMPIDHSFDLQPAKSVIWFGSSILVVTAALYVIFW